MNTGLELFLGFAASSSADDDEEPLNTEMTGLKDAACAGVSVVVVVVVVVTLLGALNTF